MKVAPIYMSKEAMIRRLTKRNSRTIQHYSEVSDKIPAETRAAIMPLVDPMARFCRKNACKIFFDKEDGLFDGDISVTISKIILHLEHAPDYYETYQPIMKTIINTQNAPREIANTIKAGAREPLEEQKKLEQEALQRYYETHPFNLPWP